MKNIINVSHILISLCLQIGLYCFTKSLYSGVLASCFFFAGREIAQAEYRHIQQLPTKLRADMPTLGGFNPKFWNMKSFVADLAIPTVLVLAIALIF